ncbi:hypothetical protein [Magnetospirillum sp. UT-4]|nr:hypothetical protein [Magnetospirillum sp. UT-4]
MERVMHRQDQGGVSSPFNARLHYYVDNPQCLVALGKAPPTREW